MSMVEFRAAPARGPRWIPRRLWAHRFEARNRGKQNQIVDITGLANLCGGGRDVDFQQCLTIAWRLAEQAKPRKGSSGPSSTPPRPGTALATASQKRTFTTSISSSRGASQRAPTSSPGPPRGSAITSEAGSRSSSPPAVSIWIGSLLSERMVCADGLRRLRGSACIAG